MKYPLMIAVAVIVSTLAQAQETESPPIKRQPGKNEIGMFVNPVVNDHSYEMPFGLQYKRWTTPHLGYRILAGVGGYGSESRATELIKNDTFYWSLTSTNMSMLFAGAGLEVQRRFVGKVYLYAALEFKAGYGQGYTHTSEVRETARVSAWERSYTYEQRAISSTTTSLFVLDTSPYVGAKLNFRRWVIGTEVTALVTGLMKHNHGGYNYSSLNFDFGQFQQRLYVNYRF